MPAQERGPMSPTRTISTNPARSFPRRRRYVERTISSQHTEKPAAPNAIRRHGRAAGETAGPRSEHTERETFWTSQMNELRKDRRHSRREIDIFVGRTMAHLESLSERDELTTLYSRKGINRRFESVLSRAERTGEKVSLALMDLDKFKDINDTYGHGCGDEVIKNGANHLRRSGRGHDIWGRWGGEEFIGILPGANIKQAAQALERQRIHLPESVDAALSQNGEYKINRDITMSVGVVTYDPKAYEERFGTRAEQLRRILIKKGKDLSEMNRMTSKERAAILEDAEKTRKQAILEYLTKKADNALYKAKENGRDKVIAVREDEDGNEMYIDARLMPSVLPVYDKMGA